MIYIDRGELSLGDHELNPPFHNVKNERNQETPRYRGEFFGIF